MRKISVFNFISLNGFFQGPHGDFSWHQHGADETTLSEEGLRSGSILLFGRVTYELMAKFWPTDNARKAFPAVAEGMNAAAKIVLSRTLKKANWNNTQVLGVDSIEALRTMKESPGEDMTLLGSGSVLTQLAERRLIDEYQIMVDPVVIGEGTAIFNGIRRTLNLKLTATRTFKSGAVLLCYTPAES